MVIRVLREFISLLISKGKKNLTHEGLDGLKNHVLIRHGSIKVASVRRRKIIVFPKGFFVLSRQPKCLFFLFDTAEM